jgi:hypothetical protein
MPPKAPTSCIDGHVFATPSKTFVVVIGVPECCIVTKSGDKEISISKMTLIPAFFLGVTTAIIESVAAENPS